MKTNSEITIYNSNNLRIQYLEENGLFIQDWNASNHLTLESFKSELMAFKKLFIERGAKNALWLQEGFNLDLRAEDHLWIEENINIECVANGLEKVAFVVGKDVLAHMSVFDYFEELPTVFTPKHFASKSEAMLWILNGHEEKTKPTIEEKIEIQFLGKLKNGKSRFTIETNSEDTEKTLKSFKHILKESTFIKQNAYKYYSLTQREQEVFRLYAKGISLKAIAEKLFVSEFTIRTHWRNIKKKLTIKSLSDIVDYTNAFLK